MALADFASLSIGDATALNGDGSINLGSDSTLTIAGFAALGQTVSFTSGKPGTLALADPTDFTSTIAGFVSGDTIDLTGISDTDMTAALVGSNLVVSIDGVETYSFALSNPTPGETFAVNSDGASGADITVNSAAPTLTTLANFNGADGQYPQGTLMADAAGDLFGTTSFGGANNNGVVYQIAKTSTGYASTPTVLTSLTAASGGLTYAGLIADAAGDLFGTTEDGGANGYGTVFEIAKTSTGYASTPTVLANFTAASGVPVARLLIDASGNLYSTTSSGGANDDGTVFEIAKTSTGYAGTPTVLVNFNSANGKQPVSGLIADAAGDLFGTTYFGGANDVGTVFEISKTSAGYASTPTILTSFSRSSGAYSARDLIADAAGDLFGTTEFGGTDGDGTVFEIAKTSTGYASTPMVLVNFDGANVYESNSLIVDAAGNLFGTASGGGANNDGVVFEIAKTAAGYASTPTVLANFDGANGATSNAGLIADAAGDLFGVTAGGGANNYGTVFELSGSGYQVTTPSWR